MKLIKIMEFGLKWIHMARYELILKLDGAPWLTIIFKPLLTQKRANNTSDVHRARHYQNPLYQQKARAHMPASAPDELSDANSTPSLNAWRDHNRQC